MDERSQMGSMGCCAFGWQARGVAAGPAAGADAWSSSAAADSIFTAWLYVQLPLAARALPVPRPPVALLSGRDAYRMFAPF